MIYAIFLCTAFAGRPELNTCEIELPEIYQTAEQCDDRLDRFRSQNNTQGRNGIESVGHLGDGTKMTRFLTCDDKQSWMPVQ
jgi:hypothetical protein